MLIQEQRPSARELLKKLIEAKEALKNGRGLFANEAKTLGELNDLDLDGAEEVWGLIGELLEEITPNDYSGTRPPQKSYERAIAERELIAFSWQSVKMGKKMYIKFALKNGRYYYVSLHRSKKQNGDD